MLSLELPVTYDLSLPRKRGKTTELLYIARNSIKAGRTVYVSCTCQRSFEPFKALGCLNLRTDVLQVGAMVLIDDIDYQVGLDMLQSVACVMQWTVVTTRTGVVNAQCPHL